MESTNETTKQWLAQAREVCESAARGDLEARVLNIEGEIDEDLAATLHAINHLLDMTDAFVREASASLSFASDGRYFRRVLPAGLLGSYRQAAHTINHATKLMGDEATQLQEAESQRAELVGDITDAKKGTELLVESTRTIEEMSNMIKRIARQTNLLSLNASIEAARAGQAGKGFAVVAEEVKKLANQSESATADIQESVASIQDAASCTVDSIARIWEVFQSQSQTDAAVAPPAP